jgi:site-specific recombinase XerD
MSINFRKKVNNTIITHVDTPLQVKRMNPEALYFELATLEDYCKNRKRKSLSITTIDNYKAAVNAIVKHVGYLEYSNDYVRATRSILETKGKSPATIFLYMSALQELFRANFDENYEISKPSVTIDTTNDEKKYLSIEQIERLFQKIDKSTLLGIRDDTMLALLYFAALRNSELGHLTVSDYDEDKKYLLIQEHGDWHPKNYQKRKINVPDVCNEKVKAWLKIREQEHINNPTMFMTSYSRPFDNTSLRDVIVRRGKNAGLNIHPHMLRHSRCSHLANGANGSKPWSLGVLCKFMGHSNISTTGRYMHSGDIEQKKCLSDTKEAKV